MSKPKRTPCLVMGVYNDIASDGRVQRAADALSACYDVCIVWPGKPGKAEKTYESSSPYPLKFVPVTVRGRGPIRFAQFMIGFITAAVVRRPQIVYAHDYFLSIAGLIAARLAGAVFIYDAHELLLARRGVAPQPRLRLFRALERFASRRAELVIAANEPRARIMRVGYGLRRRPTVVRNLPAGQLEKIPVPSSERGEPSAFRLIYQGHVSLTRRLDVVVGALPHLEDVQLLVAGDGPALDALRQLAEMLELSSRVEFLGHVPRSRLPDLMGRCHVGILSYPASDLNNVFCAPNKLYEYAQLGLPMIGIGSTYLRTLIERAGIGCWGPAGCSPAGFAQLVQVVRREWVTLHQRSLDFARTHSWGIEEGRLKEAVKLAASGRTTLGT